MSGSAEKNAHDAAREELRLALLAARDRNRGVPPSLEPLIRAHARSARLAKLPIEQLIIQVKALVHETTGDQSDIFVTRIVGWTVAGYFKDSRTSGAGDG